MRIYLLSVSSVSEWEAHVYFIPSLHDGFHMFSRPFLTMCSV